MDFYLEVVGLVILDERGSKYVKETKRKALVDKRLAHYFQVQGIEDMYAAVLRLQFVWRRHRHSPEQRQHLKERHRRDEQRRRALRVMQSEKNNLNSERKAAIQRDGGDD